MQKPKVLCLSRIKKVSTEAMVEWIKMNVVSTCLNMYSYFNIKLNVSIFSLYVQLGTVVATDTVLILSLVSSATPML